MSDSVLTGKDLLARLPTDVVETPAGRVEVHGLGALDLVEFSPRAKALGEDDEAEQIKLMVDIVARGLDISTQEAGRISVSVLGPLFASITRLSGLDESAISEAVEGLKAIPNDES